MTEVLVEPARLADAKPGAGGVPAELWSVDQVLVVVAHPDDESFGLGGVIAWVAQHSVALELLCFTAGEASTVSGSAALGAVRAKELQAAAAVLGVGAVWLEGMPDGGLSGRQDVLEALIEARWVMPGRCCAWSRRG